MDHEYEFVVLALDVLIGDPDIINPSEETPQIASNLVISSRFLAKFTEIYNEQSTRGDAAKQFMEILNRHMEKSDEKDECELANHTILHILEINRKALKGVELGNTGHQAIAAARHYKSKGKKVAVMTGSGSLAPTVRFNGIDVLEVNRDIYTGRRSLKLPYEFSNEWYSNNKIPNDLFAEIFPNEPPLRPNEFVEFQSGPEVMGSGNFAHIGRYDPYVDALVPLKHVKDLPYGIYPRNAGQAMLTEALMTPPDILPIVIAPGTFGTGKTFLTLAAGLSQTEGNGHKAIYDRIFVCPRDSYLGREHGYLKGDLMDKLTPLLGPLKDNLREIIKKRGPKASKYRSKQTGVNDNDNKSINNEIEWYLMESDVFEFEAVINMGGRSINNSFIIFDEFQDMERGQAKALLTRIGNGSKNVILGDPSQFTNPHLSRTSNGLVYASSVFSNYEGAAVVTLFPHECVRSEAGQAVSAIFGY